MFYIWFILASITLCLQGKSFKIKIICSDQINCISSQKLSETISQVNCTVYTAEYTKGEPESFDFSQIHLNKFLGSLKIILQINEHNPAYYNKESHEHNGAHVAVGNGQENAYNCACG